MDFQALLVAGTAVLTASVTAIVTRKRDASEAALKSFSLLVEQLSAQNDRLEARVQTSEERARDVTLRLEALEQRLDANAKKRRILQEKYSSSLAYIGILLSRGTDLLSRLDEISVPHGKIPLPPKIIVADLESPQLPTQERTANE